MSRKIIHITAGDETWTPTTEDLQDIIKRFQSETVFTNTPDVKLNEIPVDPNLRQQIIISVGSAEWQPTKEELDAITGMFNNAILAPSDEYIVATRSEVKAYIRNSDKETT